MRGNQASGFLPLTGLYEPSAIVQLADGRFLVVEDEKEHPFSLVEIDLHGRVESSPLEPGWFEGDDGFWKLDDLEGLTLDRSGWIHAVTSQSLSGDGEQKKSREKLVRFRIEGDRVSAPEVVKGLKSALVAAHPELAAAARLSDVKGRGGLNVEALEFSADNARLFVGFRSPLRDKRALVASIENPSTLFEKDESPRIAPALEALDLGGNGIRGMSYLLNLDGFLMIAGPASEVSKSFQLWFWRGETGAPARRVSIPGLSGLAHAEGICPALIDGQQKIVIVSDDGDRERGRFAHYALLDPGDLRIAAE
ncbi:MAG: DUF3616 domain-containing protein [Propionivibrio sp.]